jgi:hypothetical protein
MSDGVVIGGGGLFLRDTNANSNSGWQWNCPIHQLERITTPIVLFAVGYNRFRNQPDFDPIFAQHLEVLARKSIYIALRNTGSIRAIKNYLPEEIHRKLRFQPCMTTICRKIYPEIDDIKNNTNGEFRLAVNAAFDRPAMRFGKNEAKILGDLAVSIKAASRDAKVELVEHLSDDGHIAPFLRSAGIKFDRVSLMGATPERILNYYSSVNLVIGMRGHAQMIPFGCGTPIVSIVSHDKMRWFLEDIERPEWGIEVADPEIREKLPTLVSKIRNTYKDHEEDIKSIHNKLHKISIDNVNLANAAFSK